MTIKVIISGEGLSFEKETTLQKAGQIVAFLGRDEDDVEYKLSTNIGTLPGVNPIISSIKEQIIQSKAKTNAEKITVVGKHLSQSSENGEFLGKEVLLQLRKNGDVPSNFTRDLNTAIGLQYIYRGDKDGIYGITEKGKQAIIHQFKDEIKIKSGKKGGTKKANPPRDEVTRLSIVGDLNGYPSFHSLSTRADKILWILAFTDENKISELTPREVEFVSDKLKSVIKQRDFAAYNKRNINESYIAVANGTFKLQQTGIEYLKSLINLKKDEKKHE